MGPFARYPDPLIDRLRRLAHPPRFSRPHRVAALACLIVAMGLTDLACTLAYLHGVGLIELNPLARFIIEHGGAASLACFKTLTLLICVGLLVRLRARKQAEFAAWACMVVMVALTLHWARYNEAIAQLTPYLSESFDPDAAWVRLGE